MKYKIFIVLILCITFLTSCWGSKEINEVAIVIGFMIDKDPDTNKYLMGAEIITPKGGQDIELAAQVVLMEGDTIFDAIRNMILKIGKKLYWPHTKIIVISERLAREGVSQAIDFINRDAEVRTDIELLILDESNIAGTLETNDKIHPGMSFHLEDTLKSENEVGKFPRTIFRDFINALNEDGIEPVIPSANIETVDGYEAIQPKGTAIFKHDKMIGYLDENDTKSFLLLSGKAKKCLYIIKNVLDTESILTLELFNNNVDINPIMIDDELSIKMNVDLEAGVGEIIGKIDVSKEESVKKLEKYSQKVIKTDLEELIKKIQNEYNSDIVGIGKYIHNRHPKIWRDIGENWENVFPFINIEVNVNVNINGTGLTLKPAIKEVK